MQTPLVWPAHQTLHNLLLSKVQEAFAQVAQAKGVPLDGQQVQQIQLTPPKFATQGDLACSFAVGWAKRLKTAPQPLAQSVLHHLGNAAGLLTKAEIAGPGYVNLFFSQQALQQALAHVIQLGDGCLQAEARGKRVLLEYVSANPTGPMHVAHGRGAVMGDTLAKLLTCAGYQVEREYYVNDLGKQIDVLAQSIFIRYQELHGRSVEKPADFYPGDYVMDMAKQVQQTKGDTLLAAPEATWLPLLRDFGTSAMLLRIRSDLAAFGVEFDRFVSESSLNTDAKWQPVLQKLRDGGHLYEEEGKLWFKTTAFGDDKDRVVTRDDGRPTYFASDIIYHNDKMQRGYDWLINVWGADHSGYVARVKAGVAALGFEPDNLTVLLNQMISLSRGGESVKMGKRLGTAVWLREVLQEVGKDATRYMFLMRRLEAQMDFDLDLAMKKTLENPVYYAQMGHARLCSILDKARDEGVGLKEFVPETIMNTLAPLAEGERDILKVLAQAPDRVAAAAQALEPHHLVHYLQELIGLFHSYYQDKAHNRVVSDDAPLTQARLWLCFGLQQVMAALLQILGVDAPRRMFADA